MTDDRAELVLVARARRPHRRALRQAELAFERRRDERERQRVALDGATALQSATLVSLAIAFLIWAAWRALL